MVPGYNVIDIDLRIMATIRTVQDYTWEQVTVCPVCGGAVRREYDHR